LATVGSNFLYVSDAPSHALAAYAINVTTGALTAVPGSPFPLGFFNVPEGLASAHGNVYAGDAGSVDALALNPTTGVPTVISGSPFLSGTNLFLATDPAGKFLFASIDDPPGGIFAFTIDPASGALTAVPGSPFPIPGQTVLNSQPSGILTDVSGRFVFAALTGSNQVAAFSIDGTTGVLTSIPGSPFAAGGSPLTLATTSKFLYANSIDGTIWCYGIDQTSGALAPVAGSPFPFAAAGLSIDPTGKYLYGTRAPGIEVFSIDSTNGTIAPIAGSPFPAAGPLQLTIIQLPGQGG
jgi:6-phosphogluconolactonase (cycloisomerase 2 family)